MGPLDALSALLRPWATLPGVDGCTSPGTAGTTSLVTLDLAWRKSTRCGSSTCVEVAPDGDRVWMRDSKNPDQAPLQFTAGEWSAFIAGVRGGELADL